MEPAHSSYGLSCIDFLDLLILNSVNENFQDFWNKFSLIFGQLCDNKTCAFVMMGIGKKVVWAGGGRGRGYWADSVLFVDVCVGVRGAEGGLGGHNQASKVALAAKY